MAAAAATYTADYDTNNNTIVITYPGNIITIPLSDLTQYRYLAQPPYAELNPEGDYMNGFIFKD